MFNDVRQGCILAEINLEKKMPELARQSGGLDINIEDGVDYSLPVVYKEDEAIQDVSGYSAAFELRDRQGASNALLSLSEASGITIGSTDGRIDVVITAAQAIFGNRKMVYDLVITPSGGTPVRLLRGECQSTAKGD